VCTISTWLPTSSRLVTTFTLFRSQDQDKEVDAENSLGFGQLVRRLLLILPLVKIVDSLAGKSPTYAMMSVSPTDSRTHTEHLTLAWQSTHNETDLEEEPLVEKPIVLQGMLAAVEASDVTHWPVRRVFTLPPSI
jgi:hypothetical protein